MEEPLAHGVRQQQLHTFTISHHPKHDRAGSNLDHGLPWSAAEHDREQHMRARIATLRSKVEEEKRPMALPPSCRLQPQDLSSSQFSLLVSCFIGATLSIAKRPHYSWSLKLVWKRSTVTVKVFPSVNTAPCKTRLTAIRLTEVTLQNTLGSNTSKSRHRKIDLSLSSCKDPTN
jgi:hypothetical protein